MNPYAIPSLLAFVVNLSLGVYILSKDAKYLLNRIYALFASSMAIWAFGEFMWRCANNAEQAFLWDRIAGFGYCFTAPLLVNFMLIFSKKKKILQRKVTYVALYLPSLIFLYLLWKTNLITKGMIKVKWGYTYLVGTLNWIWALWSTTLIILALYLCIQFYRKTKIRRERMQARFVFIGIFISCVTALITDVFLPLLKIHVLTMCIASSMAMVGFIAYAITRYRLFVFTPSTAAGDILATMGDSMILVGSDGGILSVNRATEEILEYKEKELVGKSLATIFKEGTSILKELTEKGIIHDYEITYRTKNGDSIPVSFSGSVMRDEVGEIMGIVCTAHDMREIKRLMEKERRLSLAEAQAEREKSAIIDGMPDSLVVLNLDGELISVNPAHLKMFGHKSADEILGKGFEGFKERFCDPEKDIPRFLELFRGVIEKGFTEKPVEIRLRKVDGTEFFISASASLLRDAEGNPKNVVAVLRDITELKRAEEIRLKAEIEVESARATKEIIQGMPDPLIVLNLGGEIVSVNPAYLKMFGFKSMDEAPKGSFDTVREMFCDPEKDIPRMLELFRGVIEKGFIEKPVEIRLRKVDGTEFFISASGSLLRDAEGNPKNIVAVIRDITELKKTEEELKKRMAQLEKFTNVAVGRELKMKQMEKELATLRTLIATLRTQIETLRAQKKD